MPGWALGAAFYRYWPPAIADAVREVAANHESMQDQSKQAIVIAQYYPDDEEKKQEEQEKKSKSQGWDMSL